MHQPVTKRVSAVGALALLLAACATENQPYRPAPMPHPVRGPAMRPGLPPPPVYGAPPPAGVAQPQPSAPAPSQGAPGAGVLLPQGAAVGHQHQLADGTRIPAVQALIGRAQAQVNAGQLDAAAISLERAQRLAPQSAAVYQRLADVRLRQQRPAEAEQLLRRALGYATSTAQQAAIWRELAVARQKQGKAAEAQQAAERAAALEAPH